MKRLLLILLALVLLTGCNVFLPDEKEPHQVCGPLTPIWVYNAERTDSFIGAYAKLCYTEWRVPTPYGDSVVAVTDTTVERR